MGITRQITTLLCSAVVQIVKTQIVGDYCMIERTTLLNDVFYSNNMILCGCTANSCSLVMFLTTNCSGNVCCLQDFGTCSMQGGSM